MKEIIFTTFVSLTFLTSYAQDLGITLSYSIRNFKVEKQTDFTTATFNAQVNDNDETKLSFIPAFYYSPEKKEIATIFIRHYHDYWQNSTRYLLSLLTVNEKLEFHENSYPYFPIAFPDYNKNELPLNRYLAPSCFPAVFIPLESINTQLYDTAKTIEKLYNKNFSINLTNYGLKMQVNIKKNLISITLPTNIFANLSQINFPSFEERNKSFITSDRSDFEKLSRLVDIVGCKGIDFIVKKNIDSLSKLLLHYNSYNFLKCVSEPTLLEMIKKYCSTMNVTFDYLVNKTNFNSFYKKDFPSLSEAKIYSVIQPKQILNLSDYANHIKNVPSSLNDSTLANKMFVMCEENLELLSRLFEINRQYVLDKKLDEIRYFNLVKNGSDALHYIKIFTNPRKLENCTINQFYLGKVQNKMANGIGKSINNSVFYDGNFLNGKYHGSGLLYNSTGNLEYSGNFNNGVPNGIGTFYEYTTKPTDFKGVNGQYVVSKYEGEFKSGKFHGKGKLTHYKTTSILDDDIVNFILEGNFVEGKKEGYFTEKHIQSDGSATTDEFVSSGNFENNLREGTWTYRYKDKSFGLSIGSGGSTYYEKGVVVVKENSNNTNNQSSKSNSFYEILSSSNAIIKIKKAQFSDQINIYSKDYEKSSSKDYYSSITPEKAKYFKKEFRNSLDDNAYSFDKVNYPVLIQITYLAYNGKSVSATIRATSGISIEIIPTE